MIRFVLDYASENRTCRTDQVLSQPRPDDSAVSDDEDGQKMQSDPGHGGSESAEPGILQRGQREPPTRAYVLCLSTRLDSS